MTVNELKPNAEMLKSPLRFEFINEMLVDRKKAARPPKSSLERLIYNSENISHLLASRTELKTLRFDELELLREIRDLVDSDPKKFEHIKNPVEFRRAIRIKVLPKFITREFIRMTQEKLLNELLKVSHGGIEQDSLMTALVFLQSHTDLGLPMEDNPLWEIIFNLSLKDGLRFIDSLTVLLEGMDSLKIKDPELLTRDPIILQKTRQICQWPIFWKLLIAHQEIVPFEGIVSALLRGEVVIEIYFDELVHLPLYLHQLFAADLNDPNFLSEMVTDQQQETLARQLYDTILKSAEKDLPSLLPTLIKRLEKLRPKTAAGERAEPLDLAIHTLSSKNPLANNIFLITLLAAKISMRKYWENQRDRFFFFTILKDPMDAKNYFDYGHILLKQRHIKTAEQLFECAIEIGPQSFWGYWGLATCYLKSQKLDKADDLLETALKLAQQMEIQTPLQWRRELFLIKDELKRVREKKVKQQASQHLQIDMFAG